MIINFSALTRSISSISNVIARALNPLSIFRQCFRGAQNVTATLNSRPQSLNNNFSDIRQSIAQVENKSSNKNTSVSDLVSNQSKSSKKSYPIKMVDMGQSLTVIKDEALKTSGISDCTAINCSF